MFDIMGSKSLSQVVFIKPVIELLVVVVLQGRRLELHIRITLYLYMQTLRILDLILERFGRELLKL
jgi:hypothetical protein